MPDLLICVRGVPLIHICFSRQFESCLLLSQEHFLSFLYAKTSSTHILPCNLPAFLALFLTYVNCPLLKITVNLPKIRWYSRYTKENMWSLLDFIYKSLIYLGKSLLLLTIAFCYGHSYLQQQLPWACLLSLLQPAFLAVCLQGFARVASQSDPFSFFNKTKQPDLWLSLTWRRQNPQVLLYPSHSWLIFLFYHIYLYLSSLLTLSYILHLSSTEWVEAVADTGQIQFSQFFVIF